MLDPPHWYFSTEGQQAGQKKFRIIVFQTPRLLIIRDLLFAAVFLTALYCTVQTLTKKKKIDNSTVFHHFSAIVLEISATCRFR